MRAGLILTGVFLMVIGFALIITIIGAILGIFIGFVGFIVLIAGLVTSGKKEVYVPAAQQQVVIAPGPQSTPVQAGQGQISPQPLSQDTKFCQNCGSKMSKTGTYCPNCGAKQPS